MCIRDSARIERGDGLKVRFPPSTYGDADGLTNADAGTQYRVGGALMTVASVQGDVITFAPPHDFNETSVVVATKYDEYGLAREAGLVEVETPGFRPAYYYAGDRTSALIFRYRVRRGDFSDDLDYLALNSLGCPGPARQWALTQGEGEECYIRRDSPRPTGTVNLELRTPGEVGSLAYNARIKVDTTPANVTNISTAAALACHWPAYFASEGYASTAAACVYGKGHLLDITVAFDRPVSADVAGAVAQYNRSIAQGNITVTRNYAVFAPAYLAANVELDITTSTTRPATAFYASGSGTKDLHFVYDIREGDYNEGDLDTVPTVEGRRALQPGFGGIVGYLRSSSSNPETDINYDSVPEPGAYNSLSASPGQARVIVDADAAIITDIEAPSRTYSPGDNLDIKVTWSEKIIPPKNCSGSHFMLWLDLANDRLAAELGAPKYVPYGAQALPHNGSATRSLTFRYIVRVGDESERLETACVPCASAVVETAALWANASCNPLTLATNRPASLILPLRSDENTLGKSSNVVVTSAMPKILKVDADSSDVQTAPLAAGDVLRVFVRYDAAVVVAGDVAFPATKPYLDEAPRLELTIGDGQDSPFRGHDRAHRLISARYASTPGYRGPRKT